ncbi:hypothetical protein SeMB42_g05262 [Synchytrium endobioticum]|uniref:At4g15545-like C-terminal domain-containing protein n=1 Tax=Synchytrium endobioticum TaxID=286115 RepID=A0A507CSK7_9FUNG|nr:hypothetical protein SeLEV6574_g07073 [Synchytrium endobioticum]TPX42147.1 hypothetical protein SeMB42_g05262 [Synchytrium endobioticum]
MAADTEFEHSLRQLREAHQKMASAKDAELASLRAETSRKNDEIKDLQTRVSQLEIQLARSDKRIAEMSRAVTKLASFKQSVLESIADEDIEEVRVHKTRAGIDQDSNASPVSRPDATGAQPYQPPRMSLGSPDRHANMYASPVTPHVPVRAPPTSNARMSTSFHDPDHTPAVLPGAVDGREFFKRARAILSYDEFTSLLWNVRQYNNREQSRHRTLENLNELLGGEAGEKGRQRRDLYEQFEKLLSH